MQSTARPAHPSAATLSSNSSSSPFGTCVDPTPPACASPSTAPASAPAPPAALHTCAQAAAGRAIRASRAVWQRAGSRAGPTPRLPTPVHAHRLHHFLSGYTPRLRDTLVQGFTFGFHIPSTKSIESDHFIYVNNHASSLANSAFTTVKLEHEVAMGRIEGPFLIPTPPNVVLSPLGVVPKKVPGEFRLIHDLSFPKGDSVNSHIDRSFTEVHYELLDHCISIIRSLGPNCQIAKADIKDAFRIIPIHPNDHKLLGFSWQGKFYYDKCLPMGCSVSCQTFELFANALQWILMSKLHVQFMSHILDDFIFFGPPDSRQSHAGLQAFLSLAHSLNIPLRHDKTVFPTTIISLHGIEVDTASMQMRLPLDKLHDARNKIDNMYRRKKVTLREVQSLIGTLNFACKVVVPGRTFLRRIIDLTLGMVNAHHCIRLTVEARLDLSAWKLFLDQFNGMSLLLDDTWVSSNSIRLYSDASGYGFAAIYGKRWFQGRFPNAWASSNIAIKELLPIMLAVQLWGCLMANSRILFMCDNMSIVAVLNSHTAKEPQIMQLLRRLVVSTMTHNIHFASKHIPGKINSAADALSRLQNDAALQLAPWLNAEPDRLPKGMLPW